MRNFRSYFLNLKKYQAPLEKYVFPVILLLYPLIGLNLGLDITDTTYGLSNYEFLGNIDPMWALSTFLSNVAGRLFMNLPFAGTMLGMSVYCSFVISLIALLPYYFLQKWMPGWMIFIGEFIAESLCWCPRVIMYNYLTYLFFTLGTLLLLVGIFEWKRQNLFLVFAGVCFGMSVMARFPNVVEAAMILVLWFYAFITHGKFSETLKKTLICIAGYIAGLLIPFIGIVGLYGPGAYFEMIGSLFGMTEKASDYTAGGMISSIISAYFSTATDMFIMLPCIAAGIIMFMLLPDKYVMVKKILYIAGLFIVVKFYFSRGVFTRNYHYYDCVFQAAMMFVIIALILCIVGSTGVLNGSKQQQTLAFAALMIILITPLGSNNYTFPVINNLFIVAPVALWLMRRLMQRVGQAQYHFAWQAMISMVITVLIVQGIIFHFSFAFMDAVDGSKRDAYCSIPKVSGMKTTKENAATLDELYAALKDEGLLQDKVLLFGGVPGLSYILDMEPAIDTVWPDLDSYSTSKFDEQLMELSTSGGAPSVIMGKDLAEYANIDEKYDILMDYIANHDYNKVFENDRFMVFSSK
ncbi:hypothetical protein [Butyrivibrio sp. FCS006]|uniref:hypothetical protein n=1 Tax=Butyrivibrio sp. FCS006 TaxID=1280684 RepID=UPI0004160C89|nr:hypothetical protein [Butyrivibrio sp. FCS006]